MMKKKLKRMLVGLVAALAVTPAVCAVSDFDPAKESIFVMKVTNFSGRMIVFNGKPVGENGFKFSMFTPARFTDAPQEGYIVGRSKRGEWLALSTVGSANSCRDGNTIAFRVPPGKVGYVGDITIAARAKGFAVSSQQDPESARKYVEGEFPEWTERLGQAETRIVTIDQKCVTPYQTIYISI